MYQVLPYDLKSKKITTNINNINPGMIYVDIGIKSKDDFYTAYNKGASLIITEKSIYELNLPIIKVKDIEKAYLKLLDILYDNPLEKASFIPIFGGNRGNVVAKILESIFKKSYFKENQYSNLFDLSLFTVPIIYNFYVEGFFYYVLDCIVHNFSIIPIPFDSNYYSLESVISKNSECMIIVECTTSNMINIDNNKPGKPVIINIDEPYALTMINGKNDNVIITYGLSKKAAVTATSIDYGECTSFNYCLQRTFYSRTGNKIEPFEAPLSIKGLGINRIYAALASISCALYYDVDLKSIKDSLLDYSEKGRDFIIKKYDNFTLVDNYCTTYLDYKESFEMVQFLDYQGLYLLLSDKLICEEEGDFTIVNSIYETAINLNIKGIIITNCTENKRINEKNKYSKLKLLAKELNISIKFYKELANALIYAISIINKKDVLLILGGKEFDFSKIIIELLVTK